jgi:hypothetical protein
MLNTPPSWNWYLLGLSVKWMLDEGGVAEFARRNARKAASLYAAIDGSGGYYRNEVDPVQRLAAMDPQRRMAIIGVDARAHRHERLGDPPHRPRRQRGIAHQHAVEALAGQQPGQQTHRGTGIAAIQRAIGRLQTVDANAMDDAHARLRRIDAHPQLAKDRHGRTRVGAFEETVDPRHAIGQRRQHDRAVRNRLVAGDRELAAQRATAHRDPVAPRRHPCRVLKSAMKSTSACTPASGMAL